MGLGGGLGIRLGLYGMYLLQEGIFSQLFPFFFVWFFVFVLERNTGARSQRYQKAMADLNPATGDLLPSTAFSYNEVAGVLLHVLSYLTSFLCNHTIFQLQGTETVNKALIPSKMDRGHSRSQGAAGRAQAEQSLGSICSLTGAARSPADTCKSKTF